MQRTAVEAKFSLEEEYFLFEEKSEVRHELINGNLYERNVVSIFHNDIVLKVLVVFKNLLKKYLFKIAFESYKFRTPDKNFFYPDIMVCEANSKRYYTENQF